MSIRIKLVILLVIPTLAFLGYAGIAFREAQIQGDENAQVLVLSELATQMSSLVHECQKERGYTAGFLGSKGQKFQSEIRDQHALTDTKIAQIENYIQSNPLSTESPIYQPLANANNELLRIKEIRKMVLSESIAAKDAIGYYTALNGQYLDGISLIALQSTDANITRGLSAYAFFLKSKERAGIERAVLTNTFAADKFGPGMYAKFISLVTAQQEYLNAFLALGTEDTVGIYESASKDSSFDQTLTFRSSAFENSVTGGFGQNPQDWFKVATTRINVLKGVEDQLSQRIMDEAESKKAQASLNMYIGILVLSLTVVGGFLIIQNIIKPIRLIVSALDVFASGDLTPRLPSTRKDELGMMAQSANLMADSLSELVNDIISRSNNVAATAEQVNQNASELSKSLSDQSSNLFQVSAAVEEMNSSVDEVANKSAEAEQVARKSGEQAEQGGTVVTHTINGIQTVGGMVDESVAIVGQLGEKSDQISAIIETISEIADQTNLLALNAAIEAARAGEHGRGFAVVADEVRKLAERTSNATSEVSSSVTQINADTQSAVESINSCQSQMSVGVGHAIEAGEALTSIVQDSQTVNAEISGIAAAAKEQAVACASLTENIEQISFHMDESTNGIREASQAAQSLSEHALEMQNMTKRFKTVQS
ncbi:MAG: methyl-accepting chemotaxis protein [Phycisphaerales bacterium]